MLTLNLVKKSTLLAIILFFSVNNAKAFCVDYLCRDIAIGSAAICNIGAATCIAGVVAIRGVSAPACFQLSGAAVLACNSAANAAAVAAGKRFCLGAKASCLADVREDTRIACRSWCFNLWSFTWPRNRG